MGLEKIGVTAVVDQIGTYLSDINKMNKATADAGDATEKTAKKSEAMSKALAGIGQVVAGLGLTALFGKMVQSAGESESAVAALNAVIKSTGGVAGVTAKAAEDLASSLQKTTRFSDETILSGESMLLTFTKIGKDVFPRATKAVLDYAQKFGSVEAASIAIGKALQDPISGVTNLRRVGVMLSKQQEQQIKDFMAVGNVAGAQNIILKELETEFGGLAVAAGKTLPGKFDILRNKFDDVMEAAGGKLAPVLSDLVDVVGKLIDGLGDAAPTILLVGAAFGLLAVAAGPVGAALAIILSPIGLLIAGVVGLAAAFNSNFLGIRDLITGVWNAIKGPIEAIGADIQKIFTGLTQGFDVSGAFADLGFQIKHGLEIALSSAGIDSRIVQKVIDAFSSIQTYVANVLWPALMNFFGWLGGIWNIVSPAFNNLVNWFTQTAIPGVLDFITGTVIPGVQDFIDTLIRIWNDVSPYLTYLFDWFVNDALPTIGGVIDSFKINVLEPVIKVLAGIWEAIRPGLEKFYNWFVTEGLPKVQAVVTDLWQNVFVKLFDLLKGAWEQVRPGLEGIAKFFADNGPQISFIVGVVLAGSFAILLQIVKSLVDWLSQAIENIRKFSEAANIAQQKGYYNPATGEMEKYAGGTIGAAVLSNLFPNGVPTKPRALGGPFSAGDMLKVGEGGPELVSFGQPGFVFPNAMSQMLSGLMAQASPAYAPASSYAYNTYNNQQSMGDVNLYGVQGTDDAMRRYALLRAMGRVR